MHLFYTPDIAGNVYSLPEDESRHCQKVLRLKEGDTIHLTDGLGNLMEARIRDARSRQVTAEVIHTVSEYGKRPYRLHLAVAPTKNIDRFEWFLEKATEIGVDEVTPLLCEHSERRAVRNDRLIKVMTSAVKQSLKAYHPILHELTTFDAFIKQSRGGQLFIAHLPEQEPPRLHHACERGTDITVLVGPEGDFSPEELKKAVDAGYNFTSLGSSRLRTETAAVVACHSVYVVNS